MLVSITHTTMSRVSITNVSASIPSGLLIGGQWVKGNGEKLDSVNPDTEEVIATVRLLAGLDPTPYRIKR